MEPEFEAYLSAIRAAIRRQESDVAAIQASVDEVARVRQLVTQLPEKVRRKAMVPFGKHAFFPGELIHTNEFLVGLGCDLRLEASAVETAAVLQRRQHRAEAALRQAQQQLADLRGRLQGVQATLSNEEGEAFMEIRQDYEESEELLRSAREAAASARGGVGAGGNTAGSSTGAEAGSIAGTTTPTAPSANVAAAASSAGVGNAGLSEITGGCRERGQPPDAAAATAVMRPTGRVAGTSSGSGQAGDADADDADQRIFARLAELERLEAEAGSSTGSSDEGEDGDGDGDGDGVGTAVDAQKERLSRQGAVAAGEMEGSRRRMDGGTAAALLSGSDNLDEARPQAGTASDRSAGGAPASAAREHTAADGVAGGGRKVEVQKAGTGTALKKGFLLGSSAGSKAATRAKAGGQGAAAGTGLAANEHPRYAASLGTSSSNGGGSTSASTSVLFGGGAGPSAASPELLVLGEGSVEPHGGSAGSPASRPRRVSFADGSVPGQETSEAARREAAMVLERPARADSPGSSSQTRVRSALKQGSSNIQEAGAAQGVVERREQENGGGKWPAAHVASLEEGGDAAMAMARAREMAFTGLVREREVEAEAESAAGGGADASAREGAEGGDVGKEATAPPKRISKFKQQRMGQF